MNVNGDILLIEDDPDDQELIKEIFDTVISENNYSNRMVILGDSSEVIPYLKSAPEKPFMLISDINMPKLDGFALRNKINQDPELKDMCIPYIFFTTAGQNKGYVEKAYSMNVHGFFEKPGNLKGYKDTAKQILEYWRLARIPRYFS